MNKEKKKALTILLGFTLIFIVIPFSAVIVLKPAGLNLENSYWLIRGMFLMLIGAIGIYIAWEFKPKK